MKVPNSIKTLTELTEWIGKKHPKTIEIGKQAKIRKVWGLNPLLDEHWEFFHSIPLKYSDCE